MKTRLKHLFTPTLVAVALIIAVACSVTARKAQIPRSSSPDKKRDSEGNY